MVHGTKWLKRSDELKPLKKLDADNWLLNESTALGERKTCRRIVPGPPSISYPQTLQKTVFSNKTRFVFVMGLEGSGHHMFHKVFAKCKKCKCIPSLHNFRFCQNSNKKGLFGSEITREEITQEMDYLQAEAEKWTSMKDATVFINTYCITCGESSYPNYGGHCRRYKYSDVRLMAEIFESLEIDFRVLIVLRNAVDVLLSTTVHRGYGEWVSAAQHYSAMVRDVMMHSQLERLDKAFFTYLDYDLLPDVPAEIGEFLNVNGRHFQLKDAMNDQFRKSKGDAVRQEEVMKYTALDENKEYEKLQHELDKVKAFCDS